MTPPLANLSTAHSNFNQKNFATNFDLPSLHLLRPEIEVILHDAETHLSEFNDDDSQAPLLLDSVDTLRQVSKVLSLIALTGADSLAQIIADGFQYLYDNRDNDEDTLIMDISEGIMTLERYIEFVLLKETVEPSLILPILNTLNAKFVKPALDLNSPELHSLKSLVIANPEQNYQTLSQLGIDKTALIAAYRAGLAVALKTTTRVIDTADLQKLQVMHAATAAVSQRSDSLFWQAATTAVTNLAAALPLNTIQKRALIFVEQQFNDYLPISDARFAELVSFACHQNPNFVSQVQKKLATTGLTEGQKAAMKQFLFGPNRDVTDTLNQIIQDEIDKIKAASDSYARGENINITENIQLIVEKLQTLASVFKTLNLGEASQNLAQQAKAVQGWQQPTSEDFDSLLSSLMVAENMAIDLAKSRTPGVVTLPLYNQGISRHQLDTAYSILIRESRSGMATIENAISHYLADPAKELLHLANLPDIMGNISGACLFLNLTEAYQLLKRTATYTTHLLENIGTGSIAEAQLAKLADIMMCVDYYLESLEVHKPAGSQAMKMGQKSLQSLMVA